MAPEILNNLEKIRETCRLMQVKSLSVVGSAARVSDYSENSDVDLLVKMIKGNDGLPVSQYDYFDLWFTLENITGKKVDLIQEEAIRNKYFLQSIMQDRKIIYEA